MLDISKVYASGSNAWDTAVHDASEEYKHRMVHRHDSLSPLRLNNTNWPILSPKAQPLLR